MAEDFFKPSGGIPGNQPDSGNANIKKVPVFGVVKDNVDPIRSGRLRVYIADFNIGDPNNSDTWITVSYMSPFYGRTNATSNNTGYGTYKNNPHSYGMWNSPPDIGTTVICLFINGDINYGYWIGCVPDPEALYMVPAIGAVNSIIGNEGQAQSYAGATQLPVTNINVNNENISDTPNFIDTNRPIHSYAAHVFAQQGLIRDTIRGPITTSAQRESPSRVGWGVSTPGRPIYAGGFDDKSIVNKTESTDYKQLRVIGRRGGHSIIMDDGDLGGNDQLVRIRSALGHQILMSDNGQCLHIIHANGQSWIELGKEGTIDMYSTNSVNIRTQGDLNLHADNDININAGKDLKIQAENIKVNTEQDISFRAGANFGGYVLGKYTIKVDGAMGMFSNGEAAYVSSAVTYINGSKINLNTGSASVSPTEVKNIPLVAHTDTLYDDVKGFMAAPGKLLSIVSRAPAHAPWANAGMGVDVKVKLTASSNTPSTPTAVASATNAATNGAATQTPTVAQMATVPIVGAASPSVDTGTTAALTSASAVQAATGAAKAATQVGETIVNNAGTREVAIGSFAYDPQQMETAGFLKPGSAARIKAQIQNNVPIEEAFAPSYFTGKLGVNNLDDFKANLNAQTTGQKDLLQNSEKLLQQSGAITGKESPQQIGGMILAGALKGVNNIIDFVKGIGNNLQSTANNLIKNATASVSGIASTISSGNFTAQISAKITSGLSSITGAVDSMSKLPGIGGATQALGDVSTAAFKAISNSFKAFKANTPVTLGSKDANAEQDNASGVGNLPGGERTIANVVSGAGNSVLPGIEKIGTEIKNKATATMNNVSQSVSNVTDNLAGLANKGVNGVANDLLGQGKAELGKLSQNALSGLPNGLASQLSAAMSSISSGGPLSIKLPTVASGTTDRGTIDGQAASTFSDPGIPVPDYSGKTNPIDAFLEKRKQLVQQQEEALAKLASANSDLEQAKSNLSNATTVLPQGSGLLQAAKDAVVDSEKALSEAKKTAQSVTTTLNNFDSKALASLQSDSQKAELSRLINKTS